MSAELEVAGSGYSNFLLFPPFDFRPFPFLLFLGLSEKGDVRSGASHLFYPVYALNLAQVCFNKSLWVALCA